ncbi:MAG: lectin like domain-containing protein, partial [Candidatus Methanomethylophilaceae archaeon]
DLGLVTPAKNQGNYGTCWSFSTIASIETSLIRNGYADTSVDLSEAWLYNTLNTFRHDDPNISRDVVAINELLDYGCTEQVALLAVTTGMGLVNESIVPYSTMDTMQFPDHLATQYVVTGSKTVSSGDINGIKALLNQGYALTVNYFVDGAHYNVFIDNDGNLGYCFSISDETVNPNHLVTVIGYDDSFPASRFADTPQADGAWLLKNSWGTEPPYVDGTGCFWISYWSAGLSPMTAFDAAPIGVVEDNIYQYDGGISLGQNVALGNYGAMANVFTVSGDEVLESASFYIPENAGVDYAVSVYVDLKDPSDPRSGDPISSVRGVSQFAGMTKVQFDSDIILTEGTKFSVLVELYDSGRYVSLALDTSVDVYDGYDFSRVWAESRTTSHPGESFISPDGKKWMDISSYGFTNVRVKAYTSDLS